MQPSREGTLAAFTELEKAIDASRTGLLRYDTKSAMDADESQPEGQLAYVYDDTTPANNTVYQWDGSDWVVSTWYFDAVAGVVQPLVDDAEAAQVAAEAAAADAIEAKVTMGYDGPVAFGRAPYATGASVGSGVTRIHPVPFGVRGRILSVKVQVTVVELGRLKIVRIEDDGTVSYVAECAKDDWSVGENTLTADDFPDLPGGVVEPNMTFAQYEPGTMRFATVAGSAGDSWSFSGNLTGSNETVNTSSTTKLIAHFEFDELVADRVTRLEEAAQGLELSPQTNWQQKTVFVNSSIAWSVPGTRLIVRQPHVCRSKGDSLFAFVQGMDGSSDSSESAGLFSRSDDLGATWTAQAELLQAITNVSGTDYEDSIHNISSVYHPGTDRHWVFYKVIRQNAETNSLGDTLRMVYYDYADDEWYGAAGTPLTLPINYDDAIDGDYLGADASPPNTSGIVKQIGYGTTGVDPEAESGVGASGIGDAWFPMRVTPSGETARGLQLIRFNNSWTPGTTEPFEIVLAPSILSATHPGTGQTTAMELGEITMAELPNGNFWIAGRSFLNAAPCIIVSPDGETVLDHYWDANLYGQVATISSVVLGGLNDGQPYRLVLSKSRVVWPDGQSTASERIGIGLHLATHLDTNGRPVFDRSTGQLFPEREYAIYDAEGNPLISDWGQQTNATALCDLTPIGGSPVAGLMLDKRMVSPSNTVQINIATPIVRVGIGNFQ